MKSTRIFAHLSLLTITLALVACGGGSGGGSTPAVLPDNYPYIGGGVVGTTPNLTGATVSTFAGSGSYGSADAPSGPATDAQLSDPEGIATDGTNLYISECGGSTIRVTNIATGATTTVAGQFENFAYAEGSGANAAFNTPTAITVLAGDIYITDTYNHLIRKIVVATGEVINIAGSPGVSGDADGIGAAALLDEPAGITTDGTYLYVADKGNNKIKMIDLSNASVTTFAGSGAAGSANGVGVAASFNGLDFITSDGYKLYVSDRYNNSIRKIDISSATVSTVAGTAGVTGAGDNTDDGVGAAAKFDRPRGITTDGTNLYVVEPWLHRIRKVVISTGAVTTLAGAGNGYTEGSLATCQFRWPTGITTDGTALYITDQSNERIRKIAQ